jgi:hypothetical protein
VSSLLMRHEPGAICRLIGSVIYFGARFCDNRIQCDAEQCPRQLIQRAQTPPAFGRYERLDRGIMCGRRRRLPRHCSPSRSVERQGTNQA